MHDRPLQQRRAAAPVRDRYLQPSAFDEEPLLWKLLRVLWRQKWLVLVVSLTLFAGAIALILAIPERYTAYASVMIDPRERGISSGSLTPALLGDERAVASEMEVLRSRDLVEKVTRELGLTEVDEFSAGLGPGDAATRLREVVRRVSKQVEVAALNESRVIEVSFTAGDPALAARVTNELVEQYLATLAERNALVVAQAAEWLEGHLDKLKVRLAGLEQEAERYREATVAEVGVESSVLRQRISETSSAIVAARAAASEADARHAEHVAAVETQGARAALAASGAPQVAELLEREAEAREALQTLATQYGPTHEILNRPRRDLDALTRLVEAEAAEQGNRLAREADLARSAVRSLDAELATLQSSLNRAREREIEQGMLDREVAAAEEVYSTYLIRLREAERESTAITSAWRVSTADTPTQKSKPRRSILAMAAMLLCGSAGAGAALLRDHRRSRPRQVGRWLVGQVGLDWVAYVPEAREVRRLTLAELVDLVRTDARGSFQRAVRRLAQDVLAGADRSDGLGRVVWLTSVLPGAGKTTLATSLAAVVAGPTRRVLLVDAAVDGPRLGEIAGPPPVAGGLLGAISEPEPLPSMDLVASDGAVGLSVLPLEGPSLELVDARRLRRFLGEMSDAFDLVIVDGSATRANAPLVPVPSDVSALVVARPGDLDTQEMAELLQRLGTAGASVMGAVLNRCPRGSIPSGST